MMIKLLSLQNVKIMLNRHFNEQIPCYDEYQSHYVKMEVENLYDVYKSFLFSAVFHKLASDESVMNALIIDSKCSTTQELREFRNKTYDELAMFIGKNVLKSRQ